MSHTIPLIPLADTISLNDALSLLFYSWQELSNMTSHLCNKWQWPRLPWYDYSSDIKVVLSLEKNIYYWQYQWALTNCPQEVSSPLKYINILSGPKIYLSELSITLSLGVCYLLSEKIHLGLFQRNPQYFWISTIGNNNFISFIWWKLNNWNFKSNV